MIVQLKTDISLLQTQNLIEKINGIGYKVTEVKTQAGNYLIGIGKAAYDIRKLEPWMVF